MRLGVRGPVLSVEVEERRGLPPLTILAKGDHWVVVAKPPGMVVHRSDWAPRAPAVLQTLRDQLGERVFPVHRLDGAVSGCLLMATESKVAGLLSAALSKDTARKSYIAFVRGAFKHEGDVEVVTPMKDDNGVLRDARSVVRCLGRSNDPRCSLLEVEPATGRYHQVRRHVRDLHHPVLGDAEHGDNKENRIWRERGLVRLGLHCLSLSLDLPEGGRLDVRCPTFVDHHAVWANLPFWDEVIAARPELAVAPLDYWGSDDPEPPTGVTADRADGDGRIVGEEDPSFPGEQVGE